MTGKYADQAVPGQRGGVSAWQLYLPVAALVLFAVALAGGALWLAVVEIDRTAARSSGRLAQTAIEDVTGDLGLLAKDYAYWDVTIENVLVDLDRRWAENDLGSYLADTFGVTGSIVIDENDDVVFFWNHPTRPAFDAEAVDRVVRDLGYVIARSRASPMDNPEGLPCLVLTEMGVSVAGVAAITPERPSPAQMEPHPRPVLIVLRPLDDIWLKSSAERFALPNLRIAFDPETVSDEAVRLVRSDGSDLAFLDWDSPDAGLNALRDLAVPAIVLLVLAMAAGAVVISRAIQAQQALLSHALDLAEANSDLVSRDQQVRSALQRAEHATRAKSAFLARISHEIRTPLTAIIGFSQILKLQHRPNQEKTREQEYAEIIHESSQHLLALVNDLLDLSKIESGGFEINESWVDIAREIASTKTVLGVEADRKGVRLQIDLPDQVPALYADAKAIRQILTNLVSNALKFTPPGGLVEIRLERGDDETMTLSVADTGAGIDAQDQKTIWEPFTRARNPALAQAEGTGLGLYLVKMLAELHGAEVGLRSAPGDGTVVSVVFGGERLRDLG
ncbi:ATP-binding protein [Thalassobaculum sp. OXR-137]|uniref:sensor histidine kinase n=1 Tax=Thalassobaculum sp. OXR-137 TaxID=3100173 RepID=UPI002AC90FE3|nr:ATP-binding protein [Thalassobaculum sp. OXR-137]WPZ34585.1 ATP-binding protein [Thalassobaculum sp. OXR-137]